MKEKNQDNPLFRLNWANVSGSTENCVYRTSKFSSSGSLFKIPINSLYHPTIMFNLANKPLYALLRLWMSSQDLPCVPDLVCSGNIIMIMFVLTILIISRWSSPSHCMGCRMPDRSITAKQPQTSCKLPTIIIIIIIATINVSSSSPLWTLSALHLQQPWWSSQFTAPDREGGEKQTLNKLSKLD